MKHESSEQFDLDQLLRPSEAFSQPSEVANDPDLTLNEKRAILASWASDACAVEAAPTLRQRPGGPAVTVDEVLEALCVLDNEAHRRAASSDWAKRQGRRGAAQASVRRRKSRDPDGGSMLSA
jgi:hypothetical protein